MKPLSLFRQWMVNVREGAVDWDELEGTLVQSDLGIGLSQKILSRLKESELSAKTVQDAAVRELLSLWQEGHRTLEPAPGRMNVWLITGVNGSGKTTTIGKLAHCFKNKGWKPHLVAADTFRAAAIEQLRLWAQRTSTGFTAGEEGGDPAAAAFRGLDEAAKQGSDLVLIDTAGRLHNKENLMRELEKVNRVISKKMEGAPHESLLVVDGTSGANALEQARQFHKTMNVTGLVVTKLDSSSRGGIIAAAKSELALETLFIGKGERAEDLVPFEPERYIRSFFVDEDLLDKPVEEKSVEQKPEPEAKRSLFNLFGFGKKK